MIRDPQQHMLHQEWSFWDLRVSLYTIHLSMWPFDPPVGGHQQPLSSGHLYNYPKKVTKNSRIANVRDLKGFLFLFTKIQDCKCKKHRTFPHQISSHWRADQQLDIILYLNILRTDEQTFPNSQLTWRHWLDTGFQFDERYIYKYIIPTIS